MSKMKHLKCMHFYMENLNDQIKNTYIYRMDKYREISLTCPFYGTVAIKMNSYVENETFKTYRLLYEKFR